MSKLAVIGAGMMGSAIITGIVKNNVLKAEEIYVSDPDTERMLREIGALIQDVQQMGDGAIEKWKL